MTPRMGMYDEKRGRPRGRSNEHHDYVISIILIFVVIGIVILPILFLFDVIVTIIAMVKASEGVKYRYPLAIRLIN